MLLAYTEKKDERYTRWGRMAGQIINRWLFITIRQKEIHQMDFLIQSIKNEISPEIVCYGTLQTEGYGTRIIGYSHSSNGWSWLLYFHGYNGDTPARIGTMFYPCSNIISGAIHHLWHIGIFHDGHIRLFMANKSNPARRWLCRNHIGNKIIAQAQIGG